MRQVEFNMILRMGSAFVCLFALGCGKQTLEPIATSRLTVINDEGRLSERITYLDDENIEIDTTETSPIPFGKSRRSAKKKKFQLKRRARIKSPKLGKVRLEASHVTISGNYAYLSYFRFGDEFGGGTEIMDISEFKKPKLKSQALFADTDVSVAVEKDGVLYLGEATNSDQNSEFVTPAALEKIVLTKNKLTDSSTRLDLPSFSANDIGFVDGDIYVTSGTTGGQLSIISPDSFKIAAQIPMAGAKAVGRTEQYVVLMEGTGTNLHLYDRQTRAFISTIPMGCDNFSSAKAEIDIEGSTLYASAWSCGVIAVDLTSRVVSGQIAVKSGIQCHAVTVEDDLVFMANGSDGVWVYQIDDGTFIFLGKAKFGGSINFIASDGNKLFVASGKEGLQAIEVILP